MQYLRLAFNTKSGQLVSIKNLENEIKVEAKQTMFYYKSVSSNIENSHSSGAYIFKPNGDVTSFPLVKSTKISIFKVIHGIDVVLDKLTCIVKL